MLLARFKPRLNRLRPKTLSEYVLRVKRTTDSNEQQPERERDPELLRDVIPNGFGDGLPEKFSAVVQEIHASPASLLPELELQGGVLTI